MGRPPYRLLRESDRTRIKDIQQRYKKPLTGSEREYLINKRREIARVIADLIWFAQELPEDQLRQVFTDETVDMLISSLLIQSDNQSRSKDPNLSETIEREFRIAAMLMQKGAAKCFERVDRKNHAFTEVVQMDALRTMSLLTYAAIGKGASTSLWNYGFNSKKYEKD